MNYKVIAGNVAFELSVKLGDLKGRLLSMGAREVRMVRWR